ncbi:DUF4145 domain-containing protein [Corallococcus coralloides]|nr:DUF4145 domain-containing protein [Corallococcus coralloides]
MSDGSNELSVVGLRTILELAGKTEVPEASTANERVNALCRRAGIGERHRDWLLAVVKHGNVAVHEGVAVKGDALHDLLACVENLLQVLYVWRTPVPSSPEPELERSGATGVNKAAIG